jgi:hypothetical protein
LYLAEVFFFDVPPQKSIQVLLTFYWPAADVINKSHIYSFLHSSPPHYFLHLSQRRTNQMSTAQSSSASKPAPSMPTCVTIVCSECSDDTMTSHADGTLSCIRWDDGSLQPICTDCRAEREAEQRRPTAHPDWFRYQFRYRVRIAIEDTEEQQHKAASAATADGNRPDRVYDAAPGAAQAQAKPRPRAAASDPRAKKQQ